MTAWKLGEKLNVAGLRESNHLIGNRSALEQAFDRDGYWFFRDVLDKEAIKRLRAAYVEEITNIGIDVSAEDDNVRFLGGNLGNLPPWPRSIQGLSDRAAWKLFAQEPSISAFAKQLLGDKPFWVPIVGYRTKTPHEDSKKDRFTYVHQDSFFNEGIPFMNFWVPLVDTDSKVGGLAVAEGCHKMLYHDTTNPPKFPVPVGAIPEGAWRNSDCRVGDLLVMHIGLPHSGVSNISEDRFRFSLDIRVLPASGEVPAIGKLVSLSQTKVVIRDFDGELAEFMIDDDTICRAFKPEKLPPSEVTKQLGPGTEMIIAAKNGRASVVRPASD